MAGHKNGNNRRTLQFFLELDKFNSRILKPMEIEAIEILLRLNTVVRCLADLTAADQARTKDLFQGHLVFVQ